MKNRLLQNLKTKFSRKKTELSHLPCRHLPLSLREEKNTRAFTLVELIVVITILAILGTIAFISLQSYTVYARDSVRISNLRTIESSLKIQYTQGGSYAVPDDSVNITASGTLIRKQGVFGKQALRTVKLNSDASEDPLTGESYDYIVDNNLSEYQLVGYMEGDEVYNNTEASYAGIHTLQEETFANTGSTMKTLGQDLGIVFSGGVAVHKIPTDIDIRQPTGELTIVFAEDDEITSSSGSELFSRVYNRSKALLKNKELAKLDESLVLYFDMETTTMSGGVEVLKDLSNYMNNGGCYEDTIQFSCKSGNGPIFENDGSIFIKRSRTYVLGESLFYDTDFNKGITILSQFKAEGESTEYDRIFDQYHYSVKKGFSMNFRETTSVLGFSLWDKSGGTDVIYSDGVPFKTDFINFGASVFNPNTGVMGLHMNGELKEIETTLVGIEPEYDYYGIGVDYRGLYGYNVRQGFEGNIYNLRVYDRALSEKEIKTIYGSTIK